MLVAVRTVSVRRWLNFRLISDQPAPIASDSVVYATSSPARLSLDKGEAPSRRHQISPGQPLHVGLEAWRRGSAAAGPRLSSALQLFTSPAPRRGPRAPC